MGVRNSRRPRAHGPMNLATMRVVVFLMISIQATVGILTDQPENIVAMINESATIKCKSDETEHLVWHMYGNTSNEVELFNGYYLNFKECPCPCYKIDNGVPGKYNLNITARKETAMRYMCTEPGTLMRVSANLIVIASNLTCDYTMTEDDVTLSCVIEVYGEWVPQIRWHMSDGGKVNEASDFVRNGKVISTLRMPLPSHETYFGARVSFSESGRPTEVTAANVPTYADEWISEPLKLDAIKVSTTRIVAAVTFIGVCGTLVVTVIVVYIMKKKSSKGQDGSSAEEKKDFIKGQRIWLSDGMKKKGKHQMGTSTSMTI